MYNNSFLYRHTQPVYRPVSVRLYTRSLTHPPWTERSDGGLRRAAGHHHDVLLLHERPQAGSTALDGEVWG